MKTRSGDRESQAGIIPASITAAMMSIAPPAFGHHSPAAFDMTSTITVHGQVSRVDWRNPHVYFYLEVGDDSEEETEWVVEAGATSIMARGGWTSSTLEPGDIVSVQVNPDKNPQRAHGLLVSVTQADGTTLGRRPGGSAPRAFAANFSGIWDAQRNFRNVEFAPREYTEAGQIAAAEYTEADFPPADCVPFPTPYLTFLPYLSEIEVLEDRVLIRNEFYSAVRTIYTDGRDHPSDATRTNQGHSIGRWEGDALIVDTRFYADHRTSNGRTSPSGLFADEMVPSGSQRHTVERFELSDDRSQMSVEIFVEDPEFLAEPFVVNTIWDYAPSREFAPFDCDPENARLYEIQ